MSENRNPWNCPILLLLFRCFRALATLSLAGGLVVPQSLLVLPAVV